MVNKYADAPHCVGNRPCILSRLNHDILTLICSSLHDQVVVDKLKRTRAHTYTQTRSQDKTSLIPLSSTCRRFRAFCIPFMFQTFKLDFYDADPWALASRKLRCWNAEFAPFVREVVINLALEYEADETLFTETLPTDMAAVLSRMTTSRLERVDIKIDQRRANLFMEALMRQNIVCPSVRRLTVEHEFGKSELFDSFPNTVALAIHVLPSSSYEAGHITGAVEALSKFSNLQSFYLDESNYQKNIVNALLKVIPNIKTLVLPCSLWSDFEEFVSQLAQFRKVEVLGLASSANLNVGFHPPRCGNAYMGPRGDALVKRVQQEREAADERVARTLFSRCSQLKQLVLDVYHPMVATMQRDNEDPRTGELQWTRATKEEYWDSYF